MSHTPGPWKWENADDEICFDFCNPNGGCCGHDNGIPTHLVPVGISVDDYPDDLSQWEADTRLIAAAPDLLAACEATWEALDGLYGAAHGEPIPITLLTADRQALFNLALELVGKAIDKAKGQDA